ncbi:UNKNOWN [Stylonychia lemnae]|uniref:Uncharacterized protein n=1 Tax=Stylonychia lemnae TaxID=5949 RepID=A0A078B312_STYLE|nr:UNKNOWN [Stylonychia lemnae]|eukprot:CDW88651.1 UNKNOWN [Stylonychia lemnae]
MDTYSSIDFKKGIQQFLNQIQSKVQKQIFPHDSNTNPANDNQMAQFNYQNLLANSHLQNKALRSIDKVSRLAKAGGGADPILGGRTNSSVNKQSESYFQNYQAQEDTTSNFTAASKDSFQKIQVPNILRDSPGEQKVKENSPNNEVRKNSLLKMENNPFDANDQKRKIQSFKNPFSRESYLKFRKEMMNVQNVEYGIMPSNESLQKDNSSQSNQNQLNSQRFEIRPVQAAQPEEEDEIIASQELSSSPRSKQATSPIPKQKSQQQFDQSLQKPQPEQSLSPNNKAEKIIGSQIQSPSGANTSRQKLPSEKEIKQRHLKKLKTTISNTLNKDQEGYQQVTDTISNYFQFNEIGQIKSILRDKFNLFQKKNSMYERKPLYQQKQIQGKMIDDMDNNFFNQQRERVSTMISNKSNHVGLQNNNNNSEEEIFSNNTNIKIQIRKASTFIQPQLNFAEKSNSYQFLDKQHTKIKEEEENTSKTVTDDQSSMREDQSSMRRARPDIIRNLMKNQNFQRMMSQNKMKQKIGQRFHLLENDYIDAYEFNESLLNSEFLMFDMHQNQQNYLSDQLPQAIKEIPLDKQNIEQLKVDLHGFNEIKNRLIKDNSARKNKTTEDFDMIQQLESILNETSNISNNTIYHNFWNNHESLLHKKLSQVAVESRLPQLKEEMKQYLSERSVQRQQAEKYLQSQQSFRDKELQKLEKSNYNQAGPSIDFKKKNLDHYLKLIEKSKSDHKINDKIINNLKKQRAYGKWYINAKDFQKTLNDS